MKIIAYIVVFLVFLTSIYTEREYGCTYTFDDEKVGVTNYSSHDYTDLCGLCQEFKFLNSTAGNYSYDLWTQRKFKVRLFHRFRKKNE